MREAWPVTEVRRAEAALMAQLPDGVLMRRAAAGLARRCALLLPQVYGARVLLLIGAGDNGGDALYAGAALARRGAAVRALLLKPDRAHPGGLRALKQAGCRIVTTVPKQLDLAVDGIVGIGAKGALRPDAAAVVQALPRGVTTVAVDVPSGIDVDSGEVAGPAVRADVTVTFGCLKPGLLVDPAAARAGLVELVDIGLRPYLPKRPAVAAPDAEDIAAWWPHPSPGDDKYTRGVVGVASGSAWYAGAAVLSVGGALAGPAGFVRYAGAAADQVRQRWPEAVITERVADAGRVQAWVAGPGLGVDDRAAGELRDVLAAPVPVCLDADALTLLAGNPEWLQNRRAATVLTPHDREFARLADAQPSHVPPPSEPATRAADELAARVGDEPAARVGDEPAGRVAETLRLARALGAVVLRKGNRTIVATPQGGAYVNPTGSAALATAGTGDVLSGLIGSLLAAGVPAERAALAAAYAHGLAGRHSATEGPVTAQTVMHALRFAIAGLAPDHCGG